MGRITLIALIFLAGCTRGSSQNQGIEGFRFPMPTKDEVALVNGRPLSISDFLLIRSTLTRRSNQMTFWAGTSAMALQDDVQNKGKTISLSAALEIVEYAAGDISASQAGGSLKLFYSDKALTHPPHPEEVRKEIEAIVSSAVIKTGNMALSQLN